MQSFYTCDYFEKEGLTNIASAGWYTYGRPKIMHWGESAKLLIGGFCSIADNVTVFLGGNHRTDWITTYPFSALTDIWSEASGIDGHPHTNGDVIIGNDVWIGYGATIMSGVTIGDGAVIGSNALVAKNVDPYTIVAGNPAELIRQRFTDKDIKYLVEMKWWSWDIEFIKSTIPLLCSNNINELYHAWKNRRLS